MAWTTPKLSGENNMNDKPYVTVLDREVLTIIRLYVKGMLDQYRSNNPPQDLMVILLRMGVHPVSAKYWMDWAIDQNAWDMFPLHKAPIL